MHRLVFSETRKKLSFFLTWQIKGKSFPQNSADVNVNSCISLAMGKVRLLYAELLQSERKRRVQFEF